jgi:hypothetical protein
LPDFIDLIHGSPTIIRLARLRRDEFDRSNMGLDRSNR